MTGGKPKKRTSSLSNKNNDKAKDVLRKEEYRQKTRVIAVPNGLKEILNELSKEVKYILFSHCPCIALHTDLVSSHF